MTDTEACERLLARLAAVRWDDHEAEERHAKSRGLLALEYLRRMAIWADALGVPRRWPFFDLAVVFEPSVETDPTWLQRLEAGVGRELGSLTEQVLTDMFRWASLGDHPKERFPDFDDPYEPMVQVFERGGEIYPGHGFIELLAAPVPYRRITERLTQPPFPIDRATLDEVDENERLRTEKSLTRQAAKRAEQGRP
ncbi:hypothetical protein EV651_104116 [Kribbella sp. VKM Ac-2571]|uniref:hypothetical protein n=1 Tax=Kribbella sp. VKM Ac-2571 TaxID=2512222 RepID=UPI0010609488|nr:hypothetical protein [Kribbella sp. VKM Ac-2571]TDO66549.1 hypothetical protein EV651_104116 [Kribbella sp. VKM Ac-2571]